MKKSFIVLALALTLIFAVSAVAGAANTQINAELRPDFKIIINGEQQTFTDANGTIVYPALYNGTTYLPLRAVGNALGMNVGWDGDTQTVTLDSTDNAAAAVTNPTTPVINDTNITAELRPDFKIIINSEQQAFTDANGATVYPILYNGTTYLPLRAVGNALDMTVGWDGDTQTVTLDNKEAAETPDADKTPEADTDTSEDTDTSTDENTSYSKWITRSAGFGSAYTQNNPPQSSEIKIVGEYKWINTPLFTKYYHVVLVVENISDKTLSVEVNMTFENSSGEQTFSGEKTQNGIAPGTKRAFLFLQDTPISKYNYAVTSSEDNYSSDVNLQLKTETFISEDKVNIKIKNIGETAVENVEYLILYFSDGRVIDFDIGYCGDMYDRIQPGATEFSEEMCFDYFSSVEIYIWGDTLNK